MHFASASVASRLSITSCNELGSLFFPWAPRVLWTGLPMSFFFFFKWASKLGDILLFAANSFIRVLLMNAAVFQPQGVWVLRKALTPVSWKWNSQGPRSSPAPLTLWATTSCWDIMISSAGGSCPRRSRRRATSAGWSGTRRSGRGKGWSWGSSPRRARAGRPPRPPSGPLNWTIWGRPLISERRLPWSCPL